MSTKIPRCTRTITHLLAALLAGAAALAGGASAARADDAPATPQLLPVFKESGRKPGWDPHAVIGATFSFNDNRSVVGQPDGSTLSFGLKWDVGASYNHDHHEWRNSLLLFEAVSKTPVISNFIKGHDDLTLESIYLYHALEWFGPFVRVAADTPLFQGFDLRAAPVEYDITEFDGSTTKIFNATELRLTDALHPLSLKQSIGVFARLLTQPTANLEGRIGPGAVETYANHQIAITDDATTPQIEATRLFSYRQLGAEAVATFWGETEGKKITYKLAAEVMTPFAHTALKPGDTRSALDLTNVDLNALLSFRVVDWASVDYQFRALRQAQLLDRFQVQNNLLLTFGFAIPKPPPPPKCVP